MEEKERYAIEYDEQKFKHYFVDTNSKEIFGYKGILNILNEQDKEIRQLKEENGYIIFADGYDENGNEIHRQEFVKYKDKFKEFVEENKKLKQSQRQLAIAELEKVKEYNHTLSLGGSPYVDVFINNKIKELGGGENE